MPDMTDVVVVGGGINGAAIAYALARRGVRTILLERSFLASGPTGRSSALVRTHYSDPVTAQLAVDALRFFRHFKEITGAEAGFIPIGFAVGVTEEQRPAVEATIAMNRTLGVRSFFLSPRELHELEPAMVVDDIAGAVYEPESGAADPALATQGLANRARDLGAEVQLYTPAIELLRDGDRIRGVRTAKGDVLAGQVVVAAGPWTRALIQPLGVELPVVASRHAVATFFRPPDWPQQHTAYLDLHHLMYAKPEMGNLTTVGSIDSALDKLPADPDRYEENVTPDETALFAELVTRRYPAMEEGRHHGGWASLYEVSPDWHHIIDELPGVRGCYVVCGTSGHGFKLGPVVGEMVAKLVAEGSTPADPVHQFRLSRFTEGGAVRGAYEGAAGVLG
ncbi:MAG: FAD-binding oxidoreductase [Chloroflexi bacterium]|nr:FAD-binding oxidoreductase [Chloroflexota bacterium]